MLLLLPAMIERGSAQECQEMGFLLILPLLQVLSDGADGVDQEESESTELASNVFLNVQNLILLDNFDKRIVMVS